MDTLMTTFEYEHFGVYLTVLLHVHYFINTNKLLCSFFFFWKAMESEVNVFKNELQGPQLGHQLLTNQISRLCVCLDVYLETEEQDDGVEGPREFPREKMCLRTVRYRHCKQILLFSIALTV